MGDFFKQQKTVEGHINFISQQTKVLQDLQEQSRLAVASGEETEISSGMQEVINAVNVRSTQAKNILKKMKDETAKLKAAGKVEEVRIRENAHNALIRRMIEEVKSYQLAKRSCAELAKTKCVRRARLVFPEMSEEEINRRMANNPTGMFMEGVRVASVEAQTAYEDAQSRARDVEMLMRSVQEMYQMFADLATLVEEQGDMLNNIEVNLDQATAYIDKGIVELQKAHKTQKKMRKRYCCIAIIGVIIILVFAGVGGGIGGIVTGA